MVVRSVMCIILFVFCVRSGYVDEVIVGDIVWWVFDYVVFGG